MEVEVGVKMGGPVLSLVPPVRAGPLANAVYHLHSLRNVLETSCVLPEGPPRDAPFSKCTSWYGNVTSLPLVIATLLTNTYSTRKVLQHTTVT